MSRPRDEEDDDFGADLDALNDPDLVHLPPEPEVTNPGSITDIDGERAMSPLGRPTGARLYAQAAQFEGVTTFRVFREVHGVPVGIGTIGKDCTEEEFIATFLPNMPSPGETGRFRIRLLDNAGSTTGQEALIPISGDHVELRKLRARASDGQSHPVANIPGLDFVREQMAGAQARQNLMNDALEEERRATRLAADRMADERVGIANMAAEATRAVMERAAEADRIRAQQAMDEAARRHKEAVEAENARNAMTQTTMAGFMSAQLESLRIAAANDKAEAREREAAAAAAFARQQAADDARFAREREAADARAARDRQEAEDRRRADREDFERRQAAAAAEAQRLRDLEETQWSRRREEALERAQREREDRKEEAANAARQHELRLKELEASAARAAALATANSGGVEALLVKGATLLKLLDIDVRDVGKTVKGLLVREDDSGGSGMVQVLDTLVDRVGDVVSKGIEANTAREQLRAMQAGVGSWPTLGGGHPSVEGDDDDDDDDQVRNRRVRRAPLARTPTAKPAQADAAVPAAAAAAQPAAQPAGQPAGSPAAAASAATLPQQRAARAALRKLAEVLQTAPAEQHKDAVLSAIGGEPSLYFILEAEGLYPALVSAGVPDAVARALTADLATDGRLPETLFK